ncbi:hypothetical protein C8C85_1527 [Flavobacterium sp. 103]|uniref:hypothetical protein n=1 Tax=unclassified Flavobacterium TaxID=196869 RepID=UPI000D5F429D|nr:MULTISPECIES: hypothetical protein [unclassified Flavobacterium]PVX45722.1 hypothetical protein C8C85_1527 [Flavobacterium sp. 103]QKJ62133.1 hypothetical protein HQN62_02940 [Flavobacterium sp. M31R6]
MKKVYFIPLLCFVFLFQSCFEVIEEVKIKDDGSGHFNFVINFSQSKTKINSVLKMQKINGYTIPSKEEIKNEAAKLEALAQNTSGISNVKTNIDLTNYIFAIDLDFQKITNLNAVFLKLKNSKKISPTIATDYFTFNDKKFTRSQKIPIKALYDKLEKADKEVFQTAKYTSVYKFDSTIKSFSNKNAVTSKSNKAIKLNGSVINVINGNEKIENTITLN